MDYYGGFVQVVSLALDIHEEYIAADNPCYGERRRLGSEYNAVPSKKGAHRVTRIS